MKGVLLTNGQLRKTLAAVRSLGSKGVPAYVTETTRFNPAAYSKYCSDGFINPDPDKDRLAYAKRIADLMQRNKISTLFPMDDNSMCAVLENANLFEETALTALPPKDSYEAAADKGSAIGYAMKVGAPAPITYYPAQLDDVERMGNQFSGPVVIKPSHSSGSRGIRVVEQKAQLLKSYTEVHERFPFPLLQQFIPAGERYDVCLLFDMEANLKAAFVQKELRHFPLERGPSTMQESVHRPDLIEIALSIMKHIPWRGIVELEFMVDPRDGLPKFMEINPRFWNSLHASILAGVDFPWLLYQMACGERVEEVKTYQEGVRCRSLLPGDILHYLTNSRRSSLQPSFWNRGPQGGTDDILSLHDPMPTVGFLLACLRYAPDPRAWKFLWNRS